MDQIVRKLEEAPPTPGTPDAQGRRTITLHVEAETTERQLKRAVITGGSTSPFEVYCDEGSYLGGDDSAPSPLAYLSLGIAF
jgi:hypothetical protein